MGNSYQFTCQSCGKKFYTNVPMGQAISGNTHEVFLNCPHCHNSESNNVQAPVDLAVTVSKTQS